MRKKVVFITGTRADYGKIKPLIQAVEKSKKLDVYVFVCGMHLIKQHGNTYREVLKDGYHNTYVAYGLSQTQDMSMNLGNTISYMSGYMDHVQPDMIVVHGDRMDALAGAVVGALKNIIVGHIEGGELSGTIDESTRHAISKFAHVHFVCMEEAKKRLIQLGEEEKRIYVIGSPDIDVMLNEDLPSLENSKKRYDIPFEKYHILMYHPVTTEHNVVGGKIRAVVDAVLKSKKNYIVIYPNNDLGAEVILNEYKRLENQGNIRMFPSIRFEYFLSLLKNAESIIGNSSAGIRESGIYGIPAVDIGSRQSGRYSLSVLKNIQHVEEDMEEILKAIENIAQYRITTFVFGRGNSTQMFLETIESEDFWALEIQKHFVDYDL